MSKLPVVLLLSALCFFAAGVYAQIPDTFSNLQVLPKDIEKDNLVQTMKNFTAALGVRCIHCHVGEEGKPLSEFDFASDAKETKKTARIMMRMNRTINTEYIAKVDRVENEKVNVRCITCHHGQPVPRLLDDVLLGTIATSGVDSAVAQYRTLRERYYGRGVYDFGERILVELADKVDQNAGMKDAIALANLNLEFFPNSWMTYSAMGEIYARHGDNNEAKVNYEKAYSISPDPRIKKRIERLSGE